MIARLKPIERIIPPAADLSEIRTESDVEQKIIYPFLVHPGFMGIPAEWVRTKEYMEPTDIDKSAGKRHGYIPDYSVWLNGFPLLIVEAKSPDDTIEKALRDAQLYASRINNRYPPNINPISYVLACNGGQFALATWDSETEILQAKLGDMRPGTELLAAYNHILNKDEFEKQAATLNVAFQTRRFHRAANILPSSQINEVMGVNSFAQELLPIITEYFAQEVDDEPDEVMDRGYVTTDERTEYGAVLESYLKDRARIMAEGTFQPLSTSARQGQADLPTQVRIYRQNKRITGRVQLIVGGVGAGKSLFIKRFYRRILPMLADIRDKAMWAFINFNSEILGPEEIRNAVLTGFINSLCETNNLSFQTLEELETLFHHEITQWERGPIRLETNKARFNHERYLFITRLADDHEKIVAAISRNYTSEKRIGLVVVFDNVDKRSRDVQLAIFEAAQWFKELTQALVIVNLRDTTYLAHRDEKPLDAFKNAINFYIRAPRFSLMIKKRLELVLEKVQADEKLGSHQHFTVDSGAQVTYESKRLSEFLLSIHASLFDRRVAHIGGVIESLVAKDARSALAMFADIIASPHIPTSQIGSLAATGGSATKFDEDRIIRALMRGRFRVFNNKSQYVHNILSSVAKSVRPSNFLYADILEFLIRNRKEKIDFSVEGYASAGTVVNRMGQLGYDEGDAFAALSQLVEWQLVQPESLITEKVGLHDPVQAHASAYIHMRWLLKKPEYVMATSADMNYSSYKMAQEAARVWGNQREPGYRMRQKMIRCVADYLKSEYERRVRRHAFYADLGYGGKQVVYMTKVASDTLNMPHIQHGR